MPSQKLTFFKKSNFFEKFYPFSFQRGAVRLCSSNIVEVIVYIRKKQNVKNTQFFVKFYDHEKYVQNQISRLPDNLFGPRQLLYCHFGTMA